MKTFWALVCALGGAFFWPLWVFAVVLIIGSFIDEMIAMHEELDAEHEEGLLIDE